jgi:hypothetical protein
MPSGLTRGWTPVRVKKTRQIKNLELRFDSIETEKAPDRIDCEAWLAPDRPTLSADRHHPAISPQAPAAHIFLS